MKEKDNLKEISEEYGRGTRLSFNEANQPVWSIPMRNFPQKLWDEWNADCKANFNDERWMKAWSDHMKAKLYDAEVFIHSPAPEVKEEKKDNNPLGLLKPEG